MKLIFALVLAVCCQGCFLETVTVLSSAGVLGGKGYFMYREAELREDLQNKTHELEKLKLNGN